MRSGPKQSVNLDRLSTDELAGAIHGCLIAIVEDPELADVYAARGMRALSVLRSRLPNGRKRNGNNGGRPRDVT